MSNKPKSSGTRKSATRPRKPTTIDLEAKEITKSADAPGREKKPASTAAKSVDASDTSAKSSGTTSSQTPKSADVKPSTRGSKPGGAESSFGRPQNKPDPSKLAANLKQSEPSGGDSAAEPSIASKPAPPGQDQGTKKSGGRGIGSGLLGAAAAVAGLGVIGMYDGAKDIPLIGSLYADRSAAVEDRASRAEVAALKAEIMQLKASIDTAAETQPDAATIARLSEIEESVSGLSDALADMANSAVENSTAGDAELTAVLSALSARLDTLETNIRSLASPSDNVQNRQEAIAALETSVANQLAVVQDRVEKLKQSADANALKLAAMSEQASTLEETVASVKASETVARSVAVNALGTALQNDDSIALAIASIEALGGKSAESRRLAQLADVGIPTREALLKGLDRFIDSVQNPERDTNSGTISERFWANAQNLVSFRSSGPREGDAPVAVLSRIRATVEAGELDQAKSEWTTLPPELRQRGAFWFERLVQRIEAFALYEELSSRFAQEAG